VARLNPITLFQELRRRRVFRLALIYGVGAWGVIAACDVLVVGLNDARTVASLREHVRPDQRVIDLVGMPGLGQGIANYEGLCW